jgi:hypothetical protein
MEPRTFETPGTLRVELQIPSGTIRVHGIETTQTTLSISGERDADDFTVDLGPSGVGQRLLVQARNRKGFSFRGWDREVRVDLTVPRGSDLDTETGSADLETTGELGSIDVRTGSGDVSFQDATGHVVVKAASGDVRGGTVSGDLAVHGASGDVSVRSVQGSLVCRTASGDIDVDELGGDGQVTGASGDIRIGSAAAGALTVRTVSGDVAVGVAPNTPVWLDLTSATGDAVSDLGAGDEPEVEAKLEIRAVAVSGDIRVFRAHARSDA